MALLSAGSLRSDTAAKAYSKYVDDAIPLSFQLAEKDAQLRETGLLIVQLGMAQSHLSYASDSAAVVTALADLLRPNGDLSDEEHNVAVPRVLEQLVVVTQILDNLDHVQSHLRAFTAISGGFASNCDGSFDAYRTERLRGDGSQPAIETFDGIFIGCRNEQKPDGSSGGCGWPTLILTFLESVWQVISNAEEQASIKRDAERLARDRVQDRDYQQYARTACRSAVAIFQPSLTFHDELARTLAAWLAAVPTDRLADMRLQLLRLMELRAQQRVGEARSEAQDAVARRLLGQSVHDYALRIAILLNTRIRRYAHAAALKDCVASSRAAMAARADAALAEMFGLQAQEQALKELLGALRAACEPNSPPTLFFSTHRPLTSPPLQRTETAPMRAKDPRCPVSGPADSLTLCEELFTPSTLTGARSHFRSTVRGGLCITAERSDLGSCEVCGDSTLFFSLNTGGRAWEVPRTSIAEAEHLPGRFSLQRGQATGNMLEQNLANLRLRVRQYEAMESDLRTGMTQYEANLASSALDRAAHTTATWKDIVEPRVTATVASYPRPDESIGVERTESEAITSPRLHPLSTRLAEQETAEWQDIETLYRVGTHSRSLLASADRQAIGSLQDRYFRPSGILNIDRWSPDLSPLADRIEGTMHTSADSAEGEFVRLGVSKGFYIASHSTDPEVQGQALAGITLITAADAAFARGDGPAATQLGKSGLTALDLALGFIPGVGAVNELMQIGFGMATGYDYTGHPMSSGDYALRVTGMVLNVIPTAYFLKIGSGRIGRLFFEGAQALRESQTGRALASAIAAQKEKVVEITAVLGRAFGRTARGGAELAALKPQIQEAVDFVRFSRNYFGNGTSKLMEVISTAEAGSPTVLEVAGSADDALRLFEDISRIGVARAVDSYPGVLKSLGEAGEIGFRPVSRGWLNAARGTGPPTIDIHIKGCPFREIKFIPK